MSVTNRLRRFSEKFEHEISRGVTVQLTGPDKETARAILRDRASTAGLHVTDEAVEAVIETVETLHAYAMSQEVDIELKLAQRVLTIDM